MDDDKVDWMSRVSLACALVQRAKLEVLQLTWLAWAGNARMER